MIHQLNIYGKDKVETAIQRLQDYAKVFERQARMTPKEHGQVLKM